MHFPDGFELYSEDNLPNMEVDEPQPPREPKGGLADITAGHDTPLYNPINIEPVRAPTPSPSNISSPNIEEINSYDVDFSIRKLKHNRRDIHCATFYAVFDSFKSASSFEIDYRINAADLPDDTEGELRVVVDKR